MRLCYVSDERFPSTHTDTQQMALTMDAMGGLGIDVLLVAPRMTRGPYATNQEAALREYYRVDGRFEVHFVRTVDPEARELVKAIHPLFAMRVAARHRPDVLYTRNVQVALLALSVGHRVALESYRIVDLHFPRVVKLFARASRSRRFLGVVAHSKLSAAAFRRVGVPPEKVCVAYNGAPMRQMEPRLERAPARARCRLPDRAAIVVYAGHIRRKKGLGSLAEVAAATPDMRHVWVGGDDSGSPAWGQRCALRAGARNVTVTGWLNARDVAPYLYAADALVIPPSSKPLTRHGNTVLPMKVFHYLASGRAIVAPRLPDLGELLVHEQNAWLYAADAVEAARAALETVVGDADLKDRLGSAALASGQTLSWDRRAETIRAFLRRRLEAGA